MRVLINNINFYIMRTPIRAIIIFCFTKKYFNKHLNIYIVRGLYSLFPLKKPTCYLLFRWKYKYLKLQRNNEKKTNGSLEDIEYVIVIVLMKLNLTKATR